MRVARGALRDVYIHDDRAAVFVNEQVIVLSEIATAILESVPEGNWSTLSRITSEVVAVVGTPEPPADADALIARHVHDLVAHGVLRADVIDQDQSLTPDAVEALRDCLAHVLSPDPRVWASPSTIHDDQLVTAAHRHRVVPLLARGLNDIALSPSALASVSVAARQESATVVALAADLSRAILTLQERGIRCLAFKGLALAAQAYGDPAARGTGDLDLLVHPRDLEVSYACLVSAGWQPIGGFPTPDDGWAWRHLLRTGNETTLISPSSMIDLHWHLTPARSASPDFDELWQRSVVVEVLGFDVPTLAPYDALAHSASHATKDWWSSLRGIVDVYQLMADPDTWVEVGRPLRRDQQLTLGIAARMFGTPASAPAVVSDSIQYTDSVWDVVLDRQSSGGTSHRALSTPGLTLARGLRGWHWTGANYLDLWRYISRSAMPEWLTTQEASTHVCVAVPRVLSRRLAAFIRRAWSAIPAHEM